MKNKEIVFVRENTAELLDSFCQAPAANEIVVETAVSTVSAGTERANITATFVNSEG